ncbi:MAG: SCO family protein [Gemmataceae bacterium]
MPMPRSLMLAMVASGSVMVAGFVTLARFAVPPPKIDVEVIPPATDPDFAAAIPPFELTERSGQVVRTADLLGKVWVASFVFTRCNGPCPAVTATVARLQSDFATMPDVRLVTFTVDPKRDKPDELQKYAAKYGADPVRWLFLTGPEPELHSLMVDGFKIARFQRPDGKPGEEFDHSTRLVVVDKKGNARGYYDGFPPDATDTAKYDESQKKLRAKVTALLGE